MSFSLDFDLLVEEHFKRHRDIYGFESIATLIEEVMSASTLEEAQEAVKFTAEEFLLVLPKFTPSEAWGRPDSMERKQINRLFAVIGGERTIEGKLRFLQQIAAPGNKITSPRRIISSLIILESLSAVVTSFGASSAGFVFEGFLAALFLGEQVGDPEHGSLPIQDIMGFTGEEGGGDPISLKLLGPKTKIEGSYTNLVDALNKFGKMIYIVARKTPSGRALAAPGAAGASGSGGAEVIVLEQFTFTQDNFIDALVLDARGSSKRTGEELFILPEIPPGPDGVLVEPNAQNSIAYLKNQTTWEDKYALLQQTTGYSARIKTMHADYAAKAEQEAAALATAEQEEVAPQEDAERIARSELEAAEAQETLHEAIRTEWTLLLESEASATGGKQWGISVPQLGAKSPVRKIVSYGELGQLPYSAEQIKDVAEIHMHKLNEDMQMLFQGTQKLSENINKYFTIPQRGRAITSAEEALENTKQVAGALTAGIQQTKTEPEDKEL